MAKSPLLKIHITGPAKRDIAAILDRSLREFGEAAALRYEALIEQALQDIATDPKRPGSKERSDLSVTGALSYHLSFSRDRVTGPRVKEPRHVLVYRLREQGVVEIGRLLHDSRDFKRHFPKQDARPPS